MKQRKDLLRLIVPLVLIFTICLQAQELDRKRIDSLLQCSFFDTASVSLSVFDPAKGVNLYAYNENKLFHPASNMKILTSAAALMYLGSEHTVSTEFYFDKAPVNGIVSGNLYIKGGADPDVSIDDLKRIARQLKANGVNEIAGDMVTDVSLFDKNYWGDGWMWDDGSSTDAPFITPLSVNKNEIEFRVYLKNGELTVDAIPDIADHRVRLHIVVDSTKPSNIQFRNEFPDRLSSCIIEGRLNPTDTVRERLNVTEPDRYFAALFRKYCNEEGIICKGSFSNGSVPANAYPIASISHTIYDILDDLNKQSRNLSAEYVLRLLATNTKKSNISAHDGLRYIDSLIRFSGLQPGDYRFADGSGISRYTLLSTKLLSKVLIQLYYQKPAAFDILRTVFPVMGMDGTLRRRMRGTELHGNVYAKTGTLSGVSCLTGAIHAESGRLLIFSIMMQHHAGKLNRCYELQHQLLQALYRY